MLLVIEEGETKATFEMDQQEAMQSIMKLSLHTILNDAPTHHFKFKGDINDEPITMLIDSGAI